MLEEYSYDNWDLEGAVAITEDVRQAAYAVKNIATNIARVRIEPDIAPANDGSICMEWEIPGRRFWVDVGPYGVVSTLYRDSGYREERLFTRHGGGSEWASYIAGKLGLFA